MQRIKTYLDRLLAAVSTRVNELLAVVDQISDEQHSVLRRQHAEVCDALSHSMLSLALARKAIDGDDYSLLKSRDSILGSLQASGLLTLASSAVEVEAAITTDLPDDIFDIIAHLGHVGRSALDISPVEENCAAADELIEVHAGLFLAILYC